MVPPKNVMPSAVKCMEHQGWSVIKKHLVKTKRKTNEQTESQKLFYYSVIRFSGIWGEDARDNLVPRSLRARSPRQMTLVQYGLLRAVIGSIVWILLLVLIGLSVFMRKSESVHNNDRAGFRVDNYDFIQLLLVITWVYSRY